MDKRKLVIKIVSNIFTNTQQKLAGFTDMKEAVTGYKQRQRRKDRKRRSHHQRCIIAKSMSEVVSQVYFHLLNFAANNFLVINKNV